MNTTKRNKLVEESLGLVYEIAKQFRNTDMPKEDLIQDGNIGLIRATEKFDPKRGFKFSTYAVWWIRCYMIRGIIANEPVRMPDWAFNLRANVFREIFVQRFLYGQVIDLDAIIDKKIKRKCQRKTVEQLIAYNLSPRSMDEDIHDDGGSTLHDIHADDNAINIEKVAVAREQLNRITDALKKLPDSQRAVLVMRWDGLTLDQCGEEFGVTRERIRQIQNAGLKNLNRLIDGKAVRPMGQFRQKKAG